MRKLGITTVMLLVIGLAMTNFGLAQTSGQQSAADQAQQSASQTQGAADQAQQGANQTQGAASSTADQTQGEAEKTSGGVTGAVSGAAKAVGGGVKTGAKKTKEFVVGGSSSDQNQGQTGAAAQSQTPGSTSGTAGTAQAQPEGGKLPQSASPLPLLGLLGLGSVSFGVWKARFRR